MKRTFLDRFIGFFSPEAEARRIRSRVFVEMELRAYDIAKTFPTSDWVSANGNSANAETKSAIAPGRNKARALEQNNPYGIKALNVIVGETVGAGIVPQIKARNDTITKKVRNEWKLWAETTACDYEKQQNFYGLQALAMRSTVGAGEGLAVRRPDFKTGPQIQLMESDFIVTEQDSGNVVQGIELDSNGRKVKYHLYKNHPGDRLSSQEKVQVAASDVLHVFKKERPGQVRGVTWFHPVADKMKDLDDFQYATLIRQKVSACFAAFVKTNGQSALDPAALKAKRQAEFTLQPSTVRYLNDGEEMQFANPPPAEGYADFNREGLRSIAAGLGISYEIFTGDFSQSNFSSSKMSQTQMRKNIDSWRWHMLIPQFCEPSFKWFLEYLVQTGKLDKKEVEHIVVKWVPPAASFIDPTKEIPALQKAVRAGFISQPEALTEQGRDPDQTLEEIAEWNQKLDDKKIVLDTDPRRVSQVGLVQATPPTETDTPTDNGETDSEEQNKEGGSSDEPNKSED